MGLYTTHHDMLAYMCNVSHINQDGFFTYYQILICTSYELYHLVKIQIMNCQSSNIVNQIN